MRKEISLARQNLISETISHGSDGKFFRLLWGLDAGVVADLPECRRHFRGRTYGLKGTVGLDVLASSNDGR